ncbi:DEAD/DEAH box helicase [Actinomyces capricornis]|uniref:Helicase n=1 Tax=Actinomyces capricornis TaxID=2755559 RepID=A0ABM7UB31_9ACTO|nr:DEAD/DEAH box helicase [Actinomyces capricornis]BDA64490.1 helicase [Actinomyces capricornis]
MPHPPSRDLTELLTSIGGRDGRLIHLEHSPSRPGRQADWPAWADPRLIEAYARQGITRPWTHQAHAAHTLHAGQHTVLATGTGSGKSLAAWLPVVSDILVAQDPNSSPAATAAPRQPSAGPRARPTRSGLGARRPTALYLAPTKALAAGQDAALSRLVDELEALQREAGTPAGSLRTVRTGTCDGDTPLPERDWVRAHADIVLTNPDFLHFSLLPGHERWARLLRGLRYVVVDECHAYRGVLGAHVALVLRRLLRLARRLQRGPGPTVLCASATAAEPALTAARLIGVGADDVAAVTQDGAPAGERTLALWQPALRDPWMMQDPAPEATPGPAPEDDPSAYPSARRSAVVEASELLVDLLGAGARSLVFVRSRRSAEAVAEHARRVLGLSFPELVGTVAAYRGGYLPEERRALEASLRAGRLRGLATTNALELGIDVSGLDAVLIAGWPGTRASLNQQAGRAGRAGGRGLAVLIASDNPLDAYLVHHPSAVLATPEATVFDPSNPYVLAPHLCSAASESPLRQEDLALFGLPDDSLLAELEQRGALRRRPAGWFWNTHLPGRPQDLTSLRGEGPGPVAVVEADTGTVVGTVDGAAAESTVHPGAVYIHQGRTFVVEELTQEAALVRARAAVGYRTRARSHSSVRILAEREHQEWGSGVGWSFGSVEVTSQVTGYTRMALPGMEVISSHTLDMPEHVLPTASAWWTIPLEACREAGLEPSVLPGALHAAEHASIGLLPLLATCDRWDIGGLSTQAHPQTGEPTVFIHDGHAGGAGFAERGFRAGPQWLAATLAAIEDCGCTSGCPSCVQSPKCGNNNEPLDKAGAAALLRLLLDAAP